MRQNVAHWHAWNSILLRPIHAPPKGGVLVMDRSGSLLSMKKILSISKAILSALAASDRMMLPRTAFTTSSVTSPVPISDHDIANSLNYLEGLSLIRRSASQPGTYILVLPSGIEAEEDLVKYLKRLDEERIAIHEANKATAAGLQVAVKSSNRANSAAIAAWVAALVAAGAFLWPILNDSANQKKEGDANSTPSADHRAFGGAVEARDSLINRTRWDSCGAPIP